ncbi:MAG: glycosyl transferase family 2 [Planctomycetes bacterium]|nr:glycosyl transferase family 2 [Planctomycetota bacterium]
MDPRNKTAAVILAAGKGTRMKTDLPKVLVEALGRPLLHYVLDALDRARVERKIVVVGYRADDVRSSVGSRAGVEFAEQREQLGTGHAVLMCRDALERHSGPVLVVTGDSPLVQPASLGELLDAFVAEPTACLLGTLLHDDPTGLGRIVRSPGSNTFEAIVEEKDATPEQKAIREVNMSTYLFDRDDLFWALDRIGNDNRQREYYLTDCPGLLKAAGKRVEAMAVLRPSEALSINTWDDLRRVEDEMVRLGMG